MADLKTLTLAEHNELLDALNRALEFVEDQEDCDMDSDGYHPNEAMKVATALRDVLAKLTKVPA